MIYTIQGKEYTAKNPDLYTVSDYNKAKLLVNLLNQYFQDECAAEQNRVAKHTDQFDKLTDGITLEQYMIIQEDKKDKEKIGKAILKNLKKYPECNEILTALSDYAKKQSAAKKTFISEYSTIKNSIGQEKLVSNLKLILDAQIEDITGIDFEVKGIKNVIELITAGKDALEDFFKLIKPLKIELGISLLTLKIMNQ